MNKKDGYDVLTKFIVGNRDSIYRLAYSYVHNQEDALDIIQDSICKGLTAIKWLDNPLLVKPWFYRVVVNTALDCLRKKRKYVCLDADVLEMVVHGSDDKYQDVDLHRAIDSLPTIDRTIVALRFDEGMKLEEIAMVLNANLSTIKTRLYAVLKKLRVELEETNERHEVKGDIK